MKTNKNEYLLAELGALETAELKERLMQQLQAEEPDGAFVRTALQILEERDRHEQHKLDADCVHTRETQVTEKIPVGNKSRRKCARIMATVAAVIVLAVLVLPQAANANNIVELMARWSDCLFAFFNETEIEPEEYMFKTDNPGLQQVYDAVVEMGITTPVVPMWIENGYELTDIRKTTTPVKDKLYAILRKDESAAIFTVTMYSTETSYGLFKDGVDPEEYETSGIIHYISENKNLLVASWKRERIICTLSVDCREETMYKILDSIYTTEVS